MEDEAIGIVSAEDDGKSADIIYSAEKDFYKGVGGELRLKAEGLFKKAKEKGISIEEINITTLRENREEFPGVGIIELPTFVVQVRGKHMSSGQVIIDGKQIDYFNRYKKYLAEKLEDKNVQKDERGRKVREFGRVKPKEEIDLSLGEWERFQIAKSLLEDKEFGLEKTITGACDRVIRKLMGENDWLYPEEARLLDEEYTVVQGRIARDQEERKASMPPARKATDRQLNFLKSKLKNLGLDPENAAVMREVIRQGGLDGRDIDELSTTDMSKLIDNIVTIAGKVREGAPKSNFPARYNKDELAEGHEGVRM